ncbi:alpha/beta fold hydrolase [Algoriphagus halophytocola]|uniref:Alpha/beta hydrolase n=1 Tax=Algoriphagus halophytocola TaxID=2991499 RepID=A0ABY6MM01_9BACT|nr:alpha/beta hydrolase [Algoriphagus sp. TR-M5]UZD24193.1 alpha/beta hydrolase [Algoriphagus sp. TR-M5]
MNLKTLTVIGLACTLLISCEMDLDMNKPGNLVPKTVTEDPSLPSLSLNGTSLHAETYGNPASAMVIFLHGGPGADYRNGLNVRQLADDGYYVVFYDQRGTGLSQRHDKNTYSIQLYLEDLTAVIEHYRTSTNQKVFLFGHSWGAMLAAAYINAYPDRIDGAIFAEAGGFNKQLLDEYGEASRKLNLFSEITNDVLYYDQFLTGRENEHEKLDYKLAIASSFSYAEGNDEGIEGPSPFWRNGASVLQAFMDISENEGFDFTTKLNQYQTKVLFLYGENNKSYGLSFAQKEASFFPSSEIVQIADTGHEMIYFKWDSVHPAVLGYLNSLN